MGETLQRIYPAQDEHEMSAGCPLRQSFQHPSHRDLTDHTGEPRQGFLSQTEGVIDASARSILNSDAQKLLDAAIRSGRSRIKVGMATPCRKGVVVPGPSKRGSRARRRRALADLRRSRRTRGRVVSRPAVGTRPSVLDGAAPIGTAVKPLRGSSEPARWDPIVSSE